MRSKHGKSALFLFILAGVVLGSFVGHYAGGYPGFEWLAFGETFGLTQPVTLDLAVLKLTFGLAVKINVAGILGIILAVVLFKRL